MSETGGELGRTLLAFFGLLVLLGVLGYFVWQGARHVSWPWFTAAWAGGQILAPPAADLLKRWRRRRALTVRPPA